MSSDVEELIEKAPEQRLPIEQVVSIAKSVCRGLVFAHSKGIIHRDLKPGNVMLTKPGIKLLDFGLAKLQPAGIEVGHDSALPTQQRDLKRAGAILGTIQYMAPEQLAGEETSAQSDLYSLGLIFYEMFTGERAYVASDEALRS